MIKTTGTLAGLLVGVAFATVLPASAWAGSEEGVAAYRRGDYGTALRELKPLAQQGVADAQNYLGAMYHDGQGVAQDHAAAARWFRRAADQGVAAAQYNLGVMYAVGRGVQQNYILAHMWLTLAAAELQTGKAKEHAVKNLGVVARKMTSTQIAEAQRLAREWKPNPERPGR